MRSFESSSANDLWRRAHQTLRAESARSHEGSRNGPTSELLHAALTLSDPTNRWVVSRVPAINPAFSIAEIIWILAGDNEAAPLLFFNSQLSSFAGDTKLYPGAYGYRIRRQQGFDQLERACAALSSNRDSRQVVLQLWDARADLPFEDGAPRTADVPCNVMSLLKVRSGALHWTQVMRSNDVCRGLPYNFVQFTVLHEIMAGCIGVGLGEYVVWTDSLHMYKHDATQFASDDTVGPVPKTTSLALDWQTFSSLVPHLHAALIGLTEPNLTEAQVRERATLGDAPIGYRDLIAVLGAESARRRRMKDLVAELQACIHSPALRQVWNRWLASRARNTVVPA